MKGNLVILTARYHLSRHYLSNLNYSKFLLREGVKNKALNIATIGPTWEFQLCLKSRKLASWTTTWL